MLAINVIFQSSGLDTSGHSSVASQTQDISNALVLVSSNKAKKKDSSVKILPRDYYSEIGKLNSFNQGERCIFIFANYAAALKVAAQQDAHLSKSRVSPMSMRGRRRRREGGSSSLRSGVLSLSGSRAGQVLMAPLRCPCFITSHHGIGGESCRCCSVQLALLSNAAAAS